jgi:hypothetical protein
VLHGSDALDIVGRRADSRHGRNDQVQQLTPNTTHAAVPAAGLGVSAAITPRRPRA